MMEYLKNKLPVFMVGIFGRKPQPPRKVRSVITVDGGKTWTTESLRKAWRIDD